MIRSPTFPIRFEDWTELAELLPAPWPHAAVLVDLRYHQAQGRIPSREVLADRWGWDTARTGELVASRSTWLERSLPPPELPPGEIEAAQPKGKRRWKASEDRPTHLDFEGRHKEMIALARSHATYRAVLRVYRRKGRERADLDQEILTRLAEKQELEGSAYDPARSGFGKYIWTSTRSILLHLLESATTLKETRISTGAFLLDRREECGDTHQRRLGDAADLAVADLWDPAGELDEARRSQIGRVAPREEER